MDPKSPYDIELNYPSFGMPKFDSLEYFKARVLKDLKFVCRFSLRLRLSKTPIAD